MEWHNVVAGFGVGLLVGLTGVGGGSLMTPVLVLLFGVAPGAALQSLSPPATAKAAEPKREIERIAGTTIA